MSIPGNVCDDFRPPTMTSQLHDTKNNAGVDSDSALTLSCNRDDFLWLDCSKEAISRYPQLQGINGGDGPKITGVGPCLIRHADSGEYLLDPEGVYIAPMEGHPRFRVLSSLRFKALGVRLVSCWQDSEVDVLQCRRTKHIVKLSEEGPNDHNGLPRKILVIRTQPCPNIPITRSVKNVG